MTILESAGRGLRSALANPALVLAPVAVAAATLLSFALPLVALFASAYDGLPPVAEATFQSVLLALLEPLEGLFRSPALLIGVLLALTAALTVLLAGAAFVRAGLFGVLVRAEAQAPPGAPRAAFRVASAWRAFLAAGGRYGLRFFWILNVYALVLLAVFLPLLLGAVVLAVGFANGRIVPGLVLMLLGVPVALAGAVASRLAQLAVERETLARNLTVKAGVAQGLARLRSTLGASVGLFLLFVAAGMAVGGLFAVPRLLLFLAFRGETGWALGLNGLLTLLEAAVVCALELVSTAAFVALWSEAG